MHTNIKPIQFENLSNIEQQYWIEEIQIMSDVIGHPMVESDKVLAKRLYERSVGISVLN